MLGTVTFSIKKTNLISTLSYTVVINNVTEFKCLMPLHFGLM